jgi:hypothetical protein
MFHVDHICGARFECGWIGPQVRAHDQTKHVTIIVTVTCDKYENEGMKKKSHNN